MGRPKEVDTRDVEMALSRSLGLLAGPRLISHAQVTKPLPAGQERTGALDPNEDVHQEWDPSCRAEYKRPTAVPSGWFWEAFPRP